MQAFTQKSLSQAILVGVLLAGSIAAVVVYQAQLKQSRDDEQKLAQAESDFTRLQADLVRWNTARKLVHADVALRQEPLDLSVALPPEQLNDLIPILSKVFDTDGYFSLKQFTFEWKPAKDAGQPDATALPAGPALPGLSQAGSGSKPPPVTLAHVSLQGDRTLILTTEKAIP